VKKHNVITDNADEVTSIFDNVFSQNSDKYTYTVRSKQQSLKDKARRENTIRIGGTSAE
jgi:hypothetical protein